uniref:ATP synthase epsilon chain, chloroplastic n=1 Tax=Bryopsis sp. HV04063 TaxID=1979421 RepID=A0A2P0QHA5_9CHLO|nr:ATP synthase CF1 subunit epsilon [Bryopsis sp. HV04063]ARO74122.1 ATP synthase CF1 subunit epsilon [Bryopsis sp. HV04063]
MILKVCIITPDQIFFNEQVEEVILPTNTGQMGILSNHAPIITALDIGVMLIRNKKEWNTIVLMGGFALVKQNQVTVLVNEAESEKTIDKAEAEQNFMTAKQNFEQATSAKQKVETNFIYKRARARYQAIQ